MPFTLANPVSVAANTKYWLALEVQAYEWPNSYTQWNNNEWQNAISNANPYLAGEAAKIRVNGSSYGGFDINSNADWYMKIGLQN